MKNTFVKVLLVFLLALSLIGLASCKDDSDRAKRNTNKTFTNVFFIKISFQRAFQKPSHYNKREKSEDITGTLQNIFIIKKEEKELFRDRRSEAARTE